jgi:RNA polymerase sigma-70 factor, ECF subfamily
MFNKKQYMAAEDEIEQAAKDLRKGSAEAFHMLYKRYKQKVYRFCLRMLGDEDSANDAFQETFIKVFEHSRDFRGSNFAAWLFTIARHTCLNVIRTKKENEIFNEDYHFDFNQSERNEDLGIKDVIQRAISILPVPLREALILREYEEYSYQEIAEILAIDLSLAKVRVHRARIILRKLLTPLKQELYES